MNKNIEIFDSTLRDGAQGQGISFSLEDKTKIVKILDEMGIDYIEAGNPGSNPKDMEFFKVIKDIKLKDLTDIFNDFISKNYSLKELEEKYNWFSGSRISSKYLKEYAIKENKLNEYLEAKEFLKKNIGTHARKKLSKKVIQYSLDGKFIKEFSSCIEAAKTLNIGQGNISNVCAGRSKSAGGFKWAYKLEK